MAAQLFFDHLMSTAKMADVNSEQSVETEILLADYDAPVFKIVKTSMEHLVTQKYIMQNKLTVEGFIKVTVLYQPPQAEKVSVVTQKVPFQKQLELPAGEYDVNYINIQGQCQYVNTRPQNPTRIDVRGAYMFNVKVFSQQKVEAVTAISGSDICCDSGEIAHFCLAGQNIRQFTTENALTLPDNVSRIIRVQTVCPTAATAVCQDKVTVKGEISADVFYTTTDSPQIKKHTQSFNYNQIVDINGIKENHIPSAEITVCGFSISQNQDSKKYTASLTVQIDVTVFSRQQVVAVRDAFSRRFTCGVTQQEILCDTNMYHIDKTVPLQINSQLPAEYDVCHIIFDIAPPKSYFEINRTAVKSRVTANIIGVNSQNEYECFSATEELVLDWLENCGQYDEICIRLSLAGCSHSHNSDNLQINANILAQGFVAEKQMFSLLKNFEEDCEKPLQNTDEALVVYYAEKGERVFDIAKSHNADPRDIAGENALQGDVITVQQMLFIPAFTE